MLQLWEIFIHRYVTRLHIVTQMPEEGYGVGPIKTTVVSHLTGVALLKLDVQLSATLLYQCYSGARHEHTY